MEIIMLALIVLISTTIGFSFMALMATDDKTHYGKK